MKMSGLETGNPWGMNDEMGNRIKFIDECVCAKSINKGIGDQGRAAQRGQLPHQDSHPRRDLPNSGSMAELLPGVSALSSPKIRGWLAHKQELEKNFLIEKLAEYGSFKAISKALGIDRPNVIRLMKKYGIQSSWVRPKSHKITGIKAKGRKS